MTITISASGIALDGPLVAGEKVAVTVSGLALASEDKPTLALLARFPDALLASVELAESETAGTWTGELDTATKQTALFFATARADERRDAALELVAGRASLARLTVPMANSALCPKPDGSPFASPVYIPVPGPPGAQGEPGPLRGRQYAFSVADGDTIALPEDATSIIVDAPNDANVTLVPPDIVVGADFSFYIFGAGDGFFNVSVGGASSHVTGEEIVSVFRFGDGWRIFNAGS